MRLNKAIQNKFNPFIFFQIFTFQTIFTRKKDITIVFTQYLHNIYTQKIITHPINKGVYIDILNIYKCINSS